MISDFLFYHLFVPFLISSKCSDLSRWMDHGDDFTETVVRTSQERARLTRGLSSLRTASVSQIPRRIGGGRSYTTTQAEETAPSVVPVRPDSSLSLDQAVQLSPGYLSSRDPALQPRVDPSQSGQVIDQLKLAKLISAYRTHGHHMANIDPLGLPKNGRALHAECAEQLNPAHHGFKDDDMEREFSHGPDFLSQFMAPGRKSMTLREIIAACESVYCGSYGVEYQHISSVEKQDWLRERLEVPTPFCFSSTEKKQILSSLIWSTSFERFIATKFPIEKRFGLDGAESLATGVSCLIDRSVDLHGIEDISIGSCHRGRLTMLGTVYGKPRKAILAEFAGRVTAEFPGMAGDVKYHPGHDGHHVTPGGRRVSLSLLANPSHLEAVDPVATGYTYATQKLWGDEKRTRAMCLALHGDAAFAGQGVVYETLGLSRLDAYKVGGTIRVIVNNQIGFTTDADCSRSTPYASDLAKYIDAPIIHVNADDVEAVAFVCQLAADWRAQFQEDIVIDLVCYRKFGHNEFDQPKFTQPMMYKQVGASDPDIAAVHGQTSEGGHLCCR